MKHLPFLQNKLIRAIARRQDWQAVRRICETEEHLINSYDDDNVYGTPLIRAAFLNAPDDIMLNMIAKGSLENLEYKVRLFDGSTFLHHLAHFTRVTQLRSALERTKNANVTDDFGRTPLHWCLRRTQRNYEQHRETALYLMLHGASISIKDKNGMTPLDDYDNNKCSEYERTTRSEKKQSLRKLLIELSVPGEIQARGEDAVKAFEYEMQNGEITVVNARFMFMGKEGAGKTSCVNHILGKAFNENEQSTDGIVTTTVFQTFGEDGSEWKKTDVKVSEQTKQIKEGAMAENIAKKLKRPESKQNTLPTSTSSSLVEVQEATSVLTLNERGNSKAPLGARGLSTGQSKGSHDTFEKKLPDRLHKMVVNRLAEQGPSNIDGPSEVTSIWDYAGQLKYYITHRIYLTGGASYGVVFSLVDDLNDFVKSRDLHKGKFSMTNLEMILFWLRSIFEHAVLPNVEKKTFFFNDTKISSPPISLIATHKDQLSKSEAKTRIKTMYQTIFDAIEGTAYETHVDRTIYAVDNTAKMDEGIEKLKKNVGGYMKAMARTVPTKWVDFQSKVQELGKTRLRMSFEEITTVATECGIAKEMLTTVLNYLNDTGIILYSKSNEKLKNTVITNLHMIIDFLTKIITVVKPDDIDKWPTMMMMWHKLDNEGILEEELLRHLWRHEILKDSGNFDVFIELMKMFGLIFEKQMGAQQGYRMFIVPSRMQVRKESLEVKKDEKQTVSVYVTPADFLPDGIYNTLVVAFLDMMAVKGRHFGHVKLYQNCSEFDVDDDHMVNLGAVKIGNRHALKLEVSHRIKVDENDEEEVLEPHSSICMEVLNYLRQQLKTVYGTIEGIGYELGVLCNVCDPKLRHLHKLDECLTKSNLICGRKLMATTRFKRLFSTGFDVKSADEIINFLALQTLIVGRGSKELREYFLAETKCSQLEVKAFLKNEREHGCLRDVDFGEQTAKVFSSTDNFEAFDMNTLLKLIRYCCNINHEEKFWKNPPAHDNNKLANLVRIYHYKNAFLDSRYSNRVTDEEFKNRWKDLTTLFEGIGVPVEEIVKYRNPRQYNEGLIVGFNQREFEEIRNFQALFSVIVDLGAVTMRKYILDVNKLRKKDIGTFLLNKQASFTKGRLFPDQKSKMFTPNADIDQFDVTILMSIIRNCCNIPDTFWTDPNVLTNLILIHQYRNSIVAHTPNSRMSTKRFEVEWKKVESMLHVAGASKIEIDKYNALRFTT